MTNQTLTKETVMAALATVNDPDLQKPLTELGMIDQLTVTGNDVSFEIKLTTTACPLKEKIRQDALAAVQKLPGVGTVTAEISKNTVTLQTTASRAAAPGRAPIKGIKNIIAVSSGKGGVGKSTVSVNLACALAKAGASVGILDADIYGPNVPKMMGLDHLGKEALVGETSKLTPPMSHNVKVMSIAFLVAKDKPVVWRGPMLDKLIRQFMSDTEWGELDYLVIDLPPGTGDAQLTIIQGAPLAGVVIVTTPQEVALLDSRKGLTMFKDAKVPVFGMVENMSFYQLPDGTKDYIFGKDGAKTAAEELGVDFLGAIPLRTRLREEADRGQPIVIADPESEQAKVLTAVANQVIAKVCQMGIDDASSSCEASSEMASV